MKNRLLLSIAALPCAALAVPLAAQDHEFDECSVGIESVIFSEDMYSPRHFLRGEITAILYDHTSPAIASMGYGIIYYAGEGDGRICVGQRNFRRVYLEEATVEEVPEIGTVLTIPVSVPDRESGDYSKEIRFEVKLLIDLENYSVTLIEGDEPGNS